MSELSRNNKFLIVQAKVVLTPIIDQAIVNMDSYFERYKMKGIVTSGLRDAEDQLRVIRSYLTSKGIAGKYPDAMNCKAVDKLPSGLYVWQMAWSNLLNIGVIINPPYVAKVLMDYIRNGVNRKGATINQTPHASGISYNIGGGANGITDEAKPVKAAMDEKMPGLLNYLLERENNAIHCNCYAVKTVKTNLDSNILAIQKALNIKGANPRLTEDGIAGAKTTAAIKAFQKRAGLIVDGVAGPRTFAALGISVN